MQQDFCSQQTEAPNIDIHKAAVSSYGKGEKPRKDESFCQTVGCCASFSLFGPCWWIPSLAPNHLPFNLFTFVTALVDKSKQALLISFATHRLLSLAAILNICTQGCAPSSMHQGYLMHRSASLSWYGWAWQLSHVDGRLQRCIPLHQTPSFHKKGTQDKLSAMTKPFNSLPSRKRAIAMHCQNSSLNFSPKQPF